MNEMKRKDEWLKELKFELDRYFRSEEVTEILSYYEEMIDDRMENGEDIDDILDEYHSKAIAKSMIPNVISKRTNKQQNISKNSWLILLVLFSSPLLIPLGVVYLVVMIVVLSILISGAAVAVSGIGAVVMQLIAGFSVSLSFAEFMLNIGMVLLAMVICLIIGYAIIKVSWKLLKNMAIWFSQLITRRGKSYESN